MKILIVATYFPPENSIASLRPYSWAKWWSKAGHDVTVLTTKKTKLSSNLNLDCSMFKVIAVPHKSPLVQSENRKDTENKTIIIKPIKTSLKTKIINYIFENICLKKGIFLSCRFPDLHDIWIRSATKILLNNKDACYDLLVTTGWPYSDHRIGLKLKAKNLVKFWVLDWRDLWTKNHLYSGLKIFHPYEKYLENKFHKNADLITTVSDGLADILKTMTKTPVEVVYNGFDKDDFSSLLERSRVKNKKLRISYLGSIYLGFRDPEPLLQGIRELLNEKKINSNQIELTFAGQPSTNIIELIKKYKLESIYTFKGLLPREEALQLEYDSDIVLFLEYDNPKVKGVLTGKLFECLYLAKEIWAIGTSNATAAGEIIESSNAGICFGKDVSKIKENILKTLELKKNEKDFLERSKDFTVIEKYDRKKQAEKMLGIVRNRVFLENEKCH